MRHDDKHYFHFNQHIHVDIDVFDINLVNHTLKWTITRWCPDPLKPRLEEHFKNAVGAGLWAKMPEALGSGEYRLLNQTKACSGPRLVLFSYPPPALQWGEVPLEWLDNTTPNSLRLVVASGTLVPAGAITRPFGLQPMRRTLTAQLQLQEMDSSDGSSSAPTSQQPSTAAAIRGSHTTPVGLVQLRAVSAPC